LDALGVEASILVVDAQAPLEGTREVCAGHARVAHLHREGGNTYGDAIRTGFRRAEAEWIVVMDGDGSHHPRYLADLWAARADADLVVASRYVAGGGTENPAFLILMSLMVNVVFRWVLGLPCHDVSNSYRLYRAERVQSLELECDNFDIVEEILAKLIHQVPPCRIKEIPVLFERRKAGESKRNLVAFALGYVFTLGRLLALSV
jgi:dolichol-phosphate mannosyltransferase